MNKLLASLIVGAFSAAAFATSPVAPAATPATGGPDPVPAAKAEAKKIVKEKKVAAKAEAAKSVSASAPAAAIK